MPKKSSSSGFVRLVFGTVNDAGYNTSNMDFEEALRIFKKLGGMTYVNKNKQTKPAKKQLTLPEKEYGALCHAINTKFANKIPSDGFILYKDHFYWYNYNGKQHKIICTGKIEIEGNQELIKALMEEWEKWSN